MAYIWELIEQFQSRSTAGNIRRFWLPGFFNQKNFLNTLLAVVSRQERVPLERLVITYQIMKQGEAMKQVQRRKKSKTFYIYGMWLYGAKWDRQRETICDLAPNEQTGNEMPTIQLDIEEVSPVGLSRELNGEDTGTEDAKG